ncbi:MAG: MarR family transcriptional regulator [Rhodospirillaceae bacterium]|nr:MarR family transcriptional regulator [Rhodospirillaceae bacterium]
MVGFGRHENLRLWLRLLTCTTLIESKIRAQLEGHFSVTLPQFDLMAQLDRVPEGLTMSALSERLMVSNGNVTGIVKRLIAEGLIDRQISKTDRRSFLVWLSPKGQVLFREMAERHEAWINSLFAGLSPADAAKLMTLLSGTKESVRAAKLDGVGVAKGARAAVKKVAAAPGKKRGRPAR